MEDVVTTTTINHRKIKRMFDPPLEMPITVDQQLSFEERIALGKYESRHEYFTEEMFSSKSEEKGEKRIARPLYLRKTKKTPCLEEVQAYLRMVHFRPGNTEELLAFGEQYPDFQEKHAVLALARIVEIKLSLFAPVLDVDPEWRATPCRSIGLEWCHFGLRQGIYILAFKQ